MAVSREYPAHPMVGVGVIVLRGEQVLLARRGHEPAQGLWSIPGGRLELGETLRQAALRELAEECGPDVQVNLLGVALVLDRIQRDVDGRSRYHYVLVDFVAEHISGEPVAGTDASEVRWASLAELAELRTTQNLAGYVERIIRERAAGTLRLCLAAEA
jgi:8-oxo-dGTP diphosphatase